MELVNFAGGVFANIGVEILPLLYCLERAKPDGKQNLPFLLAFNVKQSSLARRTIARHQPQPHLCGE
jgi:hypothetical protein